MSKQLLISLNGNKTGDFKQWIEAFSGEPRIAWYPSAGQDYRDFFFISPAYCLYNPDSCIDPLKPDIFLHTDYHSSPALGLVGGDFLYEDNSTTIQIISIEELPPCELTLDRKIVHFSVDDNIKERAFFLLVEIKSNLFGTWKVPLVYVSVQNAAFCAERVLPHRGIFSHIIHVRCRGGFAGGSSTGVWLLNILTKVMCEVFITDPHLDVQSGDECVYLIYPVLAENGALPTLQKIRLIPSVQWSQHGDVSWNLVQQV